MRRHAFLKIVNMSVIAAAASLLFLAGCAEDPANNVLGGGGGDDDGNGGGGGSGGGTPAVQNITIKNNTGYSICYTYIKPSNSTNWGSDIGSCLSDGQSRTFTLSQPLSANSVYDIRLGTSSPGNGNAFIKYSVSVSNGMTVTFTGSDSYDESSLPSITIQNRSGVSFNAVYIRPSSMPDTSSDWGKNYGSLSNNNDISTTIPIPLSSYTSFDIQMRSSNPTNTYTKKNVTVSNGMVLIYTSADSDNPLTTLPIIVIQNSTGYSICYAYIKPSNSTDWGSDIGSCLSDGQSRTFTLSQPLSANSVYDIRLGTNSSISGGTTFIKYKYTVSNGMIVTFAISDLTDGSDLPDIVIQNRTGVSFNAIYVKPSEASDWGRNYGSLSNNNDVSISIPIPPSSYTTFDIQMRSSNPTNTYSKKNVTISNGMVLTYTSADSDNPLTTLPIIVIQNSTGYSICYTYIKPSNSTDWGSDIGSCLSDGQSRTFTLSQSLSANSVYDIRLGTSSSISSGNQFIKYNFTVSNGMIVTFTGSDLE
jgi:hypothetical protein